MRTRVRKKAEPVPGSAFEQHYLSAPWHPRRHRPAAHALRAGVGVGTP